MPLNPSIHKSYLTFTLNQECSTVTAAKRSGLSATVFCSAVTNESASEKNNHNPVIKDATKRFYAEFHLKLVLYCGKL